MSLLPVVLSVFTPLFVVFNKIKNVQSLSEVCGFGSAPDNSGQVMQKLSFPPSALPSLASL